MKAKNKKHVPLHLYENSKIGSELNFATAEAYKLLRTNLIFSLPNEEKCRVIGITSSIRGEGKSTTALNLAYSLAEANKKVLLMELDMRLPTFAKRLSIEEKPGISNLLVGLNKIEEVIQQSRIHDNFYVITSGDIPPNPSELLESKEMNMIIHNLKNEYDFILLDLPPVNAVSDALIVSKMTNGMIMVVRQNYINKRELNEAKRQLEIIDAKVLGFVVTASEAYKEKYKNKKYKKYKKYVHGYGLEYKKR